MTVILSLNIIMAMTIGFMAFKINTIENTIENASYVDSDLWGHQIDERIQINGAMNIYRSEKYTVRWAKAVYNRTIRKDREVDITEYLDINEPAYPGEIEKEIYDMLEGQYGDATYYVIYVDYEG